TAIAINALSVDVSLAPAGGEGQGEGTMKGGAMRYNVISADCHIDLCWLPPDLFTASASSELRDRMPFVADTPSGAMWKTKRGVDIANSTDLKPLWDPYWNPLWAVINETRLPLHFHTVGGYVPEHIRQIAMIGGDPSRAELPGAPEVEIPVARAAFASYITQF